MSPRTSRWRTLSSVGGVVDNDRSPLSQCQKMQPMTIGTFEVGNLFSVLGARGIEIMLLRVAGVGRVSVNTGLDNRGI